MATADSIEAAAQAAYLDAKTYADDTVAAVASRIDQAVSGLSGLPSVGVSGAVAVTGVSPQNISEPILPTGDFSTDVKQAFDYAFSTFNQDLQGQILNFLTAFFPDIADGVKTGSDQWIIDTITNGRFVPIAVETALWNRAKDKEVIEALRAEQETIDASASRGFSVPPGVLNFTVASNQQELNKRLTTINREIAIKAFDTANENTKFAIQQAVALRTAFVSAMGDFIKVAMVQPNSAVDYAKLILEAKSGLYDSAIRLYSARIDEEKMRTGVLLENNSQELRGTELTLDNFHKATATNVDKAVVQATTAMKAAEALASVAAAALATRNSVVSISAGV